MEFEWDEDKRLSNIEKHGIDFLRARLLFDGRNSLILPSPHPHEARHLAIGIVDSRFITAIWTQRGEKVRFNSVRSSRDAEKRDYRQLYGRRDR